MTNQTNTTKVPELEFDILLYAGALISGWRTIMIAGVATALLVAGYCLTLPDIFEAFVRTNVVDTKDPGGIKPDERRASEVLTLVEHGFVLGTTRDNYLDVTLARLRSRKFTAEFMVENQIYRHLYPEQWNDSNNSWIPGFEPDHLTAFKRFSEEIRFIEHNKETDIITVRMRWTDRKTARDWANAYITTFNNHIRQKTLDEVARKQAYLRNELQKSDVVDMQKSIYRLIEAQTAIEMLANSKEEYALEIIDPATTPYDRFSPAPKRLTLFGFVIGTMLACFFLVGGVIFKRFLDQIKLLNLQAELETGA